MDVKFLNNLRIYQIFIKTCFKCHSVSPFGECHVFVWEVNGVTYASVREVSTDCIYTALYVPLAHHS